MDVFWHDTMIVIPWYLVAVAGCLLLAVLGAVVVLVGALLRRTHPRP